MRPVGPITLTAGGQASVDIILDIYAKQGGGGGAAASVFVDETAIGSATYVVEYTTFPAFDPLFATLAGWVAQTGTAAAPGQVYDMFTAVTVVRVRITGGAGSIVVRAVQPGSP